MRYLSVCSGIEAATVAWHPLGWTPVGFSEIEPFPSAVLAHHYPNVPNYGDMTKHKEWPLEAGSIDLLVGGTPCQSFSIAGLRKGISDPRGGLMLTYLDIAQRLRTRWIVWENVPGVLSSGGGRDFGSFLGALGELGYGWAYRVLDAQWVRTQRHPRAVPQRRRRVFVVGCLGDWKRAAQVLFERESVQRDSSARRTQRQGVAADAEAGTRAGCYWDGNDIANILTRKGCDDRMPDKDCLFAVLQPVAGTLGNRGLRWHTELDGHGAYVPVPFTKSKRAQSTTDDQTWVDGKVNPTLSLFDQGDTRATTAIVGTDLYNGAITGDVAATMGTPRSSVNASGPTVMQAHAFYSTDGTHGVNQQPEVSPAVKVGSGLGIPSPPAVAFRDPSPTLTARMQGSSGWAPANEDAHLVGQSINGEKAMTVRRLTPRECERLQGFPDDWTLIPWRGKPADQCPDGPRYKALGNSMAVNCMAWIGERIAIVDSLP